MDPFAPFLFPTPRQLHPVPLEFQGVGHFALLIGNNLMAEFWHLVQEGPRGPAIKAMPGPDGKAHSLLWVLTSVLSSGRGVIR